MKGHVKLLGLIYAFCGGLLVLGGMLVLASSLAGGWAIALRGQLPGAAMFGAIGTMVALALGASGLPSLVAGIGLLRLATWARWLTVAMSIFYLPAFPLGTMISAYGLWVLLSGEGAAVFREAEAERGRSRWGPGIVIAVLATFALCLGLTWRHAADSKVELTGWTPAETGGQPAIPGQPAADPRPSPIALPRPDAAPESVASPEAGGGHALYRFTDHEGRLHLVDSIEQVPPELRRDAKRLE
jgi:hypothetical protein